MKFKIKPWSFGHRPDADIQKKLFAHFQIGDMQKILMDTKKQFDDVNAEAQKKETELARVREAIR